MMLSKHVTESFYKRKRKRMEEDNLKDSIAERSSWIGNIISRSTKYNHVEINFVIKL
jgi:hypothetical protein